jgi:activating signal cointegrator 1
MKVLSLLQPWATLAVIGAKKIECRSWKTEYRGSIIIHASAKKPNKRECQYFKEDAYFKKYIKDMNFLPYGAIVGRVVLKEIYRTEWLLQNLEVIPFHNWEQELMFDDFSPNRYAWYWEQAEKFSNILPIKGHLGLWQYNGLL